MKICKHARSFTTKIGDLHGDWLGEVTRVTHVGRGKIIDLLDEEYAIELKSQLVQYSGPWACNSDTVERYKKTYSEKDLNWAFMRYGLSRSVKSLKRNKNFGSFVTSREVWFMPFDWIYQFPISYTKHSGPWRYAHEKGFPKEMGQVVLSETEVLHFHPDSSKLLEKVREGF